MKRKRSAPKPLADAEDAVVVVEAEMDKPEPEPEDPAVAEWNAFAQDHYEIVEQLPLSIHRSYSLIRELDEVVQANTARIVPATRAYISLRESRLRKQKEPVQHAPSGLDLLAHVSAAVEPPAPSPVPPLPGQEPETTNPVPSLVPTPAPSAAPPPDVSANTDTNLNPTEPSAGPGPSSANLAPAHPALVSAAPPLPNDSRALLGLIISLASDSVQAANEKYGIANTVYQNVDNQLRTLDALIARYRSGLPHEPSPDPTPPLVEHEQSDTPPPSPTKSRSRRHTRTAPDEAEDESQSIRPLTISLATGSTPARVRDRSGSRSKPKDAADKITSSPTRKGKGISNGSSKGSSSSSSRGTQKSLLNTSATQSRGASNPSATSKTPRDRPRSHPKGRKIVDGQANRQTDEKTYCYCNQVSFGEMIACDGACDREWFHLPCVELQFAPKSKWYCKDCEPIHNPKKKQRKG